MAMKQHTSGRRAFLRGAPVALGLCAAGVPFLESAQADRRRAEVPRRLVLLFSPNGSIPEAFFSPTTDESVAFGPILKPLEPFREKVLLLDGVRMGVTELAPGDPHQKGMGALFTGRPVYDGPFCGGDNCSSGTSGWASGPSIDQWIAQHRDTGVPFPTLELAVRLEGDDNRRRMSFSASERPIAPDHDPRSVFARLFQSTNQSPSAAYASELIANEYRAVASCLSTDDRARMQTHLEGVLAIERRLERLGTEVAGCAPPPPVSSSIDPRDEFDYAEISALQIDLLTAALRCGATDVASLMWSGATAKVPPVWIDGASYPEFPFAEPLTSAFHTYTHLPYQDENDPAQVEVRNKLLATYRWYADRVADLLAALDAVTEPDGSTLLDNTMVIWGSELATPNDHRFERMPFVVAGGTKFLKTGRYLDLKGEEHTALLATIALAMGLDDAPFGHPDFARDPLYGILA